MAKKVLTVDEVLAEISAKKKTDKNGAEKWVYNRFNKKNFQSLLKAMINDPEFKSVTVKLKDGGVETVDDVMVTKDFREFLRKILVKAGIDSNDSQAIMASDFVIENVDGLYEFFSTAMYLYMNSGNKFDLIPTNDFKGSIYLEEVPETIKISEAKNPKTKESLGTYETTKKSHKKLVAKSSCPSWLVSRRVVK